MLGSRPKNYDINIAGFPAFNPVLIIDFQIFPIKAVAFDQLAQNLLDEQLFGRGVFLVAIQNVYVKIVRAALFGNLLRLSGIVV